MSSEKGAPIRSSEQHRRGPLVSLLHTASSGRGYVNDTLILLGWSVLSFWNAWFLGRSLLARSVQFRARAAGPITTERPVLAGLLLRFVILFVLDMFIYMRFAWTPSSSEGMRKEWSEHSTGLAGPAAVEVEAKGLRAELAELRRENAELRLKAYA